MKARIAAALASLLCAVTGANAADFGSDRGPAQLGGYSWTGPYVGVNLGYQWASISNNPTKPSGFVGGIQGGYNWQMMNQFVFGVETDLQLSGADDRFAAWKFSNPWFGTLRGRLGYSLGNVMFYGTVGLAYGTLKAENVFLGISESKTRLGWTAGGGLEVALAGQWTARAEYLYVDFSDSNYTITGASNGFGSSVLRFGVNYRF